MNPGDAQADGLDVQTALHMTLAENREAIAEFKARAVKSARARADFKAAQAKEQLRLRTREGLPAALVKDAAYADEGVAGAYFESILQDALLDADKETIMLRKREADTMREELSRMHAEGGWR